VLLPPADATGSSSTNRHGYGARAHTLSDEPNEQHVETTTRDHPAPPQQLRPKTF
jgi:hypothetical protein